MTKRPHVSRPLRIRVWKKYFNNVFEALCPMCKENSINALHFECGHDIAASIGGPSNLDNLRPICSTCNKSMGTKRWCDFASTLNKQRKPLCKHCTSSVIDFLHDETLEWPNDVLTLELKFLDFVYENHIVLCTDHSPIKRLVKRIQGSASLLLPRTEFFQAWMQYDNTKE